MIPILIAFVTTDPVEQLGFYLGQAAVVVFIAFCIYAAVRNSGKAGVK